MNAEWGKKIDSHKRHKKHKNRKERFYRKAGKIGKIEPRITRMNADNMYIEDCWLQEALPSEAASFINTKKRTKLR